MVLPLYFVSVHFLYGNYVFITSNLSILFMIDIDFLAQGHRPNSTLCPGEHRKNYESSCLNVFQHRISSGIRPIRIDTIQSTIQISASPSSEAVGGVKGTSVGSGEEFCTKISSA
jgi:hypothetical protein